MEPKVVHRDAFNVMGLMSRSTSDDQQAGALWRRFIQDYQDQVRPFVSEALFYGVAMPTEDSGMWDYLAGMAVGEVDAGKIPQDLRVWTVPAGEYVVLEATFDTMDQAFGQLHETWLPTSPYIRDMTRPVLHAYTPHSTSGDAPVFIYVPVHTRSTLT